MISHILIIWSVKCNTIIEKGGRTVNQIYEALAVFLEELRCDTDEKEYAVKMEDLDKAESQLKEKNREFEAFLNNISGKHKEFIESYLNIVDTAHFKEEQRAYYQGIMDGIQMLGELGLIKKSSNVEFILKQLKE